MRALTSVTVHPYGHTRSGHRYVSVGENIAWARDGTLDATPTARRYLTLDMGRRRR